MLRLMSVHVTRKQFILLFAQKNVLVSGEGIVKINDFDHSILSGYTLRFSTTNKTGGGTTRWMVSTVWVVRMKLS